MNHIDEHTLELYTLKADEITGRVDEIEEHLRQCHGCRALVEEMRGYYSDLDEELKKQPAAEVSYEKALVRRQSHIKPYYEPFAPSVGYRPNTPLAKMFYFVRRHPVAVTMSSFVMFGLVGWILNDAIKRGFKDMNPSYGRMNGTANQFEVLNQKNEMIWNIPGADIDLKILTNDLSRELHYAVIDLDGDGKKEVLTSFRFATDGVNGASGLRIFSYDKRLLREIPFHEDINFRGIQYESNLSSDLILVDKFKSNADNEMIVSANGRHSPCLIARLDSRGNVLGKYYHFGFISFMKSVDINNDGNKEVILCGSNDIDDDKRLQTPVIIVVDPGKIMGKTEAVESKGFGLQPSDAEIFCISLPLTDMDTVLNSNGRVGLVDPINFNGQDALNYRRCGSYTFNNFARTVPEFDFIFSKDMHIIDAKLTTETSRLRDELVSQGKLKGTIDHAYLDNLKNGVRYWDGKEWRKEWTMVKH